MLTGAVLVPFAQAQETSVDCANAPAGLERLRHEKASTLERMAKAATSIMPIGLVLHTMMGTESKDLTMATGEYNKKIDEKIIAIMKKCNVY